MLGNSQIPYHQFPSPMPRPLRIYPDRTVPFLLLLVTCFVLPAIFAFSQTPPPAVKKAVTSLLNPPTGQDALRHSCKRISTALAAYVQAHKPGNWEDSGLPVELDDVTRLEARIDQLDAAKTIDSFMRHSVEYLMRHPGSPTFAERLWKLSAITELTERDKDNRLLTKPFLPALLNACAMLPADNPFNLEGKFLAARHYRHLGESLKEETLLRNLLTRSRLSTEARYTLNKLLGNFLESQGRFPEALALYTKTGDELKGSPQSIDMKLRSALIQLEQGNRGHALDSLRELSSTPPELRKLTASPETLETFIRLAANEKSLTDYWNYSDFWWPQWLALRANLGHKRPDDEKRLPALPQFQSFEQQLAASVASRNNAQFHDLLDLLMHGLRWNPALINQAGPALCFFAPRINPDDHRKICEFTIILCENFGHSTGDARRSATLYQTICYSDTDQHKEAVQLIESFLENDSGEDALSETMTRLWAHLAIAGHTDVNGPRKTLEKLLNGSKQSSNRLQSVLYLSQIYRSLKLLEKEKSLLKRELKHPDARNSSSVATLLSNRYRELTQDKAVNVRFAAAATEWSKQHSPPWLEFALPEGLSDPRIKDLPLSNVLNNPAVAKINPEEVVKLELLTAGSEETGFNISSITFRLAFVALYSSSPTHSAARKMLRDILRDDRFPVQLQEIVLAYSLEEALRRNRKRDITGAITHPLLNLKNERLKATAESYGRFANTDLQKPAELIRCYKDLIKNPLNQSSLAAITAVFERLLQLGELEAAEGIANAIAGWKLNTDLAVGLKALQFEFNKNLDHAGKHIPFALHMHELIRKSFNVDTTEASIDISDYRHEIDLKRLTEKEAFTLLLNRATGAGALETEPEFWLSLAELMPRGEGQLAFSFRLVEILLISTVPDLEKSYAILTTPSIIDTDDPELLSRLLKLFDKHRNITAEPYTHAAMRIVATQSRDLRKGIEINLDAAWQGLNHPSLSRILIATRLNALMARREKAKLQQALRAIPEATLLSENLVDISWPALIMAGMENEVRLASDVAGRMLPGIIAGAARKLDFNSIRLAYDTAKRLGKPQLIPERWFQCLDNQIQSERDRYSLRIIDAEFRGDWQALEKWSTKAVTEYPTYYNYYRPHGVALNKLGRIKEAVRSLETYTRYSRDEIQWHDANQLLRKLRR
jgi:hypothetical protein